MTGPPARTHLKDGAIPKVNHNPIPVPYHYREEVKKVFRDDVERGIITPVLIGAVPWLLLQRKMGNQEGPWITSTEIPNANGKHTTQAHHSRYIQTQKMVLDGVDDMKACTNNKVYWPGMNTSIHNFRANGPTCKYSPKPATGTHYHDSRMAIPTKFYPFTANPLHAASQMGSSCTKAQCRIPNG